MNLPSRAARPLLVAVLALIVSGCATTRVDKDYSAWAAADPRSILIVPVVNNTVDVDAAAYFLSTIPIPVAERGYYVFPVNVVKRLLEDDGLADPFLVHGADPMRLAALFGSDAVLYVSIERWDAKYMLLATQVTVAMAYVLKDGKTGETLWQDEEKMVYSSNQNNQGGLIGAIVGAAITKASPNYMPLARQANGRAFTYPGPGFPSGPYHPEFGKDYVVQAPATPAPAGR